MHTLILGFDSFDPRIFEDLSAQGRLPNLSRYAGQGRYARLAVSDPPQTEVSWTSIATGLDPGGHGIFDFVHRYPGTYTPFVSLLPTQRGRLGVSFVPPHSARTLFEEAAHLGYPAASLWWPATFPARFESPVRTIPGLGTPDILGRLGVGTLFSTESGLQQADYKTRLATLEPDGSDRFRAHLEGPSMQKGTATRTAFIALQLELGQDSAARLLLDKGAVDLRLGEWSPILEVTFKMGMLAKVRALTRFILTQVSPQVRLYTLPLQIHPLSSPWRYAAPPAFAKEIWASSAAYLTLGWPQDTTALEEGCISDAMFLDLCDSIFNQRERALMHLLDTFDEGVLGIVFDSLDRLQHMFRRDRPDVIESWYVKLDALVGRIAARLEDPRFARLKLLVLSDHGFADFQHKVHLNRWLLEQGYLVTTGGNGSGGLDDVDWTRTRAYAVGLNSLYVNLAGREGQGVVSPEDYPALVGELRQRLLEWRGPHGQPVLLEAPPREQVFHGPLTAYGQDILIGYAPGFRASPETGLGKWGPDSLLPNRDHWSGDHCIASRAVPGVIFSNQDLPQVASLSYRDIPCLAIGKALEPAEGAPPAPPPSPPPEDKDIIEERLKGLGYL